MVFGLRCFLRAKARQGLKHMLGLFEADIIKSPNFNRYNKRSAFYTYTRSCAVFNILRWTSLSVTWISSSSWIYISQMVIIRRCRIILNACTFVCIYEFICHPFHANEVLTHFLYLISTDQMTQALCRISVAAPSVCTLAFSEASTNTLMSCLTISTCLSSL